MEFNDLIKNPEIHRNNRLNKAYEQFEKLLKELEKKKLPDRIVEIINQTIEQINAYSGQDTGLIRLIRRNRAVILRLVGKELKMVPKNYYRGSWIAIGMSVFGVPIGLGLGHVLGNMAFIAIGLPIGMVFGMAIGSGMDKNAFNDGRQLDLD